MVTRGGHSLPELLVALMFLGATAAAVGGGAVTASRWTRAAVARQQALVAAGAVLDSLLDGPAPAAGAREEPGLSIHWRAEPDPAGMRVIVAAGPAGGALVELRGLWTPPPPHLPVPDPIPGSASAPSGGAAAP